MGAILATALTECLLLSLSFTQPTDLLSQAAKFGWGFLDLYNPTDFVNMGQALKILNAVRFYQIGIPLTYSQCVSPCPHVL
jgi:vacuolar protein sorting-associated protein 16